MFNAIAKTLARVFSSICLKESLTSSFVTPITFAKSSKLKPKRDNDLLFAIPDKAILWNILSKLSNGWFIWKAALEIPLKLSVNVFSVVIPIFPILIKWALAAPAPLPVASVIVEIIPPNFCWASCELILVPDNA